MTKKQMVQLIRDQRPEPPEGYGARVERQLARLMEEETMKKRYRVSTVLLAAALIVALLAGAAFAAGELKLFSSWLGRTAVEDAQSRVRTGIGSSEGNLAAMNVEEAIYDGRSVALVLRLTPQDPQQDALLCSVWGLETLPEDVYDVHETQEADGAGRLELLGRKDGRRILYYWPVLRINGEEVDADALDMQAQPDGSTLVWLQYSFDELQQDATVRCEITARIRPHGTDDAHMLPDVAFELTRIRDERMFLLEPVDGGTGERFAIDRAGVTFARIMGYLTVDYTYTQVTGESMGIVWRLSDADGNGVETGDESTAYLGNGAYRQTSEIQAMTEIPETLFLEAKIVGEDRLLGRVECRLVETDGALPEANEAEPEKTAVGLVMTPDGSWSGANIRLLEGSIRAGRTVQVAFSYDGDRMDAARMELVYRTIDGEIVGEAATSSGTIMDGGWYKRTEVLDGSGWPTALVIEFTLDGRVLDSFECNLMQLVSYSGEDADAALAQMILRAPVDPAQVFVSADSAYYHTRPGCSTMADPEAAVLSVAVEQGKQPCANCCKTE